MKFLFKTIIFTYNSPVYYRIHEIAENRYHAEPLEENRKAFNFRKDNDMWIGEGNFTQNQAEQLGEKIDRIRLTAN